MTVAELITLLRPLPPEALVVYPDFDWLTGDEIETVTPLRRHLVRKENGMWAFAGAADKVVAVVLE